jgi:hypothetical protein
MITLKNGFGYSVSGIVGSSYLAFALAEPAAAAAGQGPDAPPAASITIAVSTSTSSVTYSYDAVSDEVIRIPPPDDFIYKTGSKKLPDRETSS